MAIFWTIVYTPVFLHASRSIEAALIGLGSSTVLEILLGGVYGKFNDWFRATPARSLKPELRADNHSIVAHLILTTTFPFGWSCSKYS